MVTPSRNPPGYEELYQENLRLKTVQPVGSKATLFVVSTVILAISTVISIVIITILKPNENNSSIITIIVGTVVPIMTALIAGAIQQVHIAVNSRLSELLELTAAASRAEGKLENHDASQPQT